MISYQPLPKTTPEIARNRLEMAMIYRVMRRDGKGRMARFLHSRMKAAQMQIAKQWSDAIMYGTGA